VSSRTGPFVLPTLPSVDQPTGGSSSFRVGRGRSAIMDLSGICSRVGGRASSRVGSFCTGSSCGATAFSFGMAILSRRGGESFLAILAGGAFKGRRGASLGAGVGLALLLSSGGGGGSRETAMDSWGLTRVEGFPHRSSKRRWREREATKNRSSGLFREATEIYYCTTHVLSK
jgi:hypothetical protein